jgi:dehydrogenase/reductase SDR family protein 12
VTATERIAGAIDAVLEASVVGSFSRIGPVVRRRLFHWTEPEWPTLAGRTAVVTGATLGLGREIATQFASAGARVVIVARDLERAQRIRDEIATATGNPDLSVLACDVGDLESVQRCADELRALGEIHVLVHNAGALTRSLVTTSQGLELTTAVHLVGPYLLTRLIEPELVAGRARVIWVTSGGMYAEPLDLDWLASPGPGYDGVKAYAKVKRAQVALVERWAPELAPRGVTMTVMHPGWVDTPGLRQSLPTFRRIVGPLLRTIPEGVDTVAWLATAPEHSVAPGTLWLDRRARSPHRLARTRRSDTPDRRERLWSFCQRSAGLGGPDQATP